GAVAPLHPILEHHRRLAVRDPIRQRRDRELRQVQLVLPARIGRGYPFLVLPVELARLLQRQVPIVHPAVPLASSSRQSHGPRPPLPPVSLIERKRTTTTTLRKPARRVVVFFS